MTDRTATQPDEIRFSDRVVFERAYGDDVLWTPESGSQYLLAHVGLRVTDAPEDELVSRPDPFEYTVRIGGRTYRPLSGPEGTNVIVEPARGGYATGGESNGSARSSSWDVLAFEVPDDVTEADVRLRYDGVDGEALYWVPDAAREGETEE